MRNVVYAFGNVRRQIQGIISGFNPSEFPEFMSFLEQIYDRSLYDLHMEDQENLTNLSTTTTFGLQMLLLIISVSLPTDLSQQQYHPDVRDIDQ